MPQLEALLFDVDGTLADTERDGHRPAFNAAFADAGLDWEWDVSLYGELLAITGGKERIRHHIAKHRPDFTPPIELAAFIADLHRRKTGHYLERLQQGQLPLRPGVRRLLEEARAAGLRLAIVTTTTPENVTYLLRSALGEGGIDWFELIAAGDVVAAKKPAPDIYLYTLERMGLSAERCLAIEDSENGLRSAKAANLKTLITTNDYTAAQDFADAELVIDQLGEPGRPFNLIQGRADAEFVDVDLLRQVHAA